MDSKVIWSPQPKQREFMSRGEDEALFGGAAGGGKSDALIMEGVRQVHIPHYKGLILRKTYPQLTELIEKSLRYFPSAFPGAKFNESKHVWTFKNGAKLVLGSLPHPKDKYKYQGKAYDFIGFDELTHFTFEEYIYLKSRCRPNGPGTRCYIRGTANPGGVGHGWVKQRFIKAAPPMQTIWEKVAVPQTDGNFRIEYQSRIFVPSRIYDNQSLLDNDPGYLTRLASLPEAERRALLEGDWDTFSGQFFMEWRDDPAHYKDRRWTHVIEPFDIPEHWKIYRSYDYGFSKPFSCGWWAVDGNGVMYRIAELYGCTGTPDEGVKWTPDIQFRKIAEIEHQHPLLKGKEIRGVADPAIFNSQTGESVAETAAKYHIYFQKGDNSRIAGWMQCHYRLQFDEEGKPRMYVFNTCRSFIRTVPALCYSQIHAEDVDTTMEDHIADEWRYMCMTRPVRAVYKNPVEVRLGEDPLNLFNKKY